MNDIAKSRVVDLTIAGMSCASCVSRVEKVLSRVAGVHAVTVNLATETAHLQTAPTASLNDLISAVGRAGYAATPRGQANVKIGRDLLELAAAAVLSAPLFAAMVLHVPAWVQLVFATPVQFWLGARFYRAGWGALRAGTGNMDLLVALGTSAAYFLSLADSFTRGPLYFESSAAVITLIRMGKFLEGQAKRDAVRSITGLAKLRPQVAHLAGGQDLPVDSLKPGDEIELRPGERVPADGIVTLGTGNLDESPITGESLPIARGTGAQVMAGTLNLDAVLRVRVTSLPGESFLDRMARLIDGAQSSKANVQKLTDRIAAIFVPVVVAIAAVTFAAWLLAGAQLSGAVLNAVSVLVIACPCALGLATPAAILAGTAAGAKNGILLRNADVVEAAARASLVIFDKTGTLTSGQPRLTNVLLTADTSRDEVLAIAAALAESDTHPLSAALRHAGTAAASELRVLPGRGVEGVVAGQPYIMGSAAFIEDAGGTVPPASGSVTWSYLAQADGRVLAGFAFSDTLRPGARQAVDRLRDMACKVMLLTGDREAAAQSVARALGITQVVAGASPEQKLAVIQAARKSGEVVAMVGDGINDAAALAAADIGMAIGTGADVAIEAAAISLLRPEPGLVADALLLSRKTWAVLREGLFWALIYNVIGIPAAAFGLLSPTIAGGAMAASSICVLLNALRLRRWRQA